MTGLLAELGKKLADRWLSALLLPGLLFVAIAYGARGLGHAHAADGGELASQLKRDAGCLAGRPELIVIVIAAVLLAATLLGLFVRSLSGVVHRVWTARGPRLFVRWRQTRARNAAERKGRDQLERYLPARLTPAGDAFRLLGERIDAQYGLDVVLVWPRLWLLLPADSRTTVQASYGRYEEATALVAWGLCYLALGAYWFPALLIGLVEVAAGVRRGFLAARSLATLLEAAVDLHQKPLAEALAVPLPHDRITPVEGLQINNILNKHG